ncbi:MAG: tRNA pseudouridine(54/55) synthase Pus10 [Asgard group archaeon]|nr:tRNA pseudouridine(54/55) synthase Pus10 [Asgard group archaeon]
MFILGNRLLLEKKLCDHCFGRQFALLGYGLSNKERGQILKDAIVLELLANINEKNQDTIILLKKIAETGNKLALQSLQKNNLLDLDYNNRDFICEICNGIFGNLENFADDIAKKIRNEDFNSFLIGAKFYPDIIELEDNLRAKYQISTGESIKAEFTREIGKLLMNKLDKIPEFKTPDLTIIIDLPQQDIVIEKRSLYIYGRYNKFIRTIPQTKWPCYDCNGKGCKNCNFTGKRYVESVEEIIAKPILKITKGVGSKFHGAGREDIDALMLGNGRPFVLEIREPFIRAINLKKLEKEINRKAKRKIKVNNLIFADKKKVQELKEMAEKSRKTYRAKIELEKEISESEARNLAKELTNIKIDQQTPTRVLHRRVDIKRNKMVYQVIIDYIDEKHLIANIEGQGGLYIKELISGDAGRTKPSFSSILNCNARCTQLDVIYLHEPDKMNL